MKHFICIIMSAFSDEDIWEYSFEEVNGSWYQVHTCKKCGIKTYWREY